MDIARLSRPVQLFVGGMLIGLTSLLLAFTTIPVVIVIIAVLLIAAVPPWVAGHVSRARDTLLADRMGADVARAAVEGIPHVDSGQLVAVGDGQYVTVVTPGPEWKQARDAIERRVLFLQMRGRNLLQDAEPTFAGIRPIERKLDAAHRTVMSEQILRLHEIRAYAASCAPDDRYTIEGEARSITRKIYEIAGAAEAGVNVEQLRATPELDRFFTAIAECEHGHLSTPDVRDVFTGTDGVKRVTRSCRYCPSLWSEKV